MKPVDLKFFHYLGGGLEQIVRSIPVNRCFSVSARLSSPKSGNHKMSRLFYPTFLVLFFCLLTLATAGCQKDKGEDGTNSSESSAETSNGVSENDDENSIVLNDNNGGDYNPVIDPANFVSTIDHPYFTLTPGRVWVYEGKNEDGETERVEIEVTHDTKMVLGVTTIVVREREWKNGELAEDTFDWYAQDKDGNVWYFGEDSKEIKQGEVVSTAGSWEAGVNGAKPGIIMKANPQVGDAYRQEFLKGEAEDMGEVLGLNEPVSIGSEDYQSCLKIKDWTPLEPDVVEHKFYSKEVGNLILEKKVAGESGQLELIEIKSE
jgi:hypothetical protein